jgi:chemotaxis family two-component system response regulator PixH
MRGYTVVMNQARKDPTVLIADDDAGVRRVLVHMLGSAGILTVTTKDGAQALDCARRFHPDLIILDVNMPGRSGFEVCAELRGGSATSKIPILMFTGQGQAETQSESARCGADACLCKPFAFNEFMTRVHGLLGRVMS